MSAAPHDASVKCRLCGGPTWLRVDRGDTALYQCGQCAFVSGWPREAPSPAVRYEHYYDGAAPPAPESRYAEWLSQAEAGKGPGRMLEVGAGNGGLVRAAIRRGWKVAATEISASGLEALRDSGATVFAGDLAEARYPDGEFDLVVSLEVVEHVPAPLDLLRECFRVTRPGGVLLLSTPNYDGLSRHLLGVRWRVIAAEHLGYFTPRTLRAALQHAGFGDVRVRARSLDVTSWRKPPKRQATVAFDPEQAARLRDAVQSRPLLRAAREAAHAVLGATRLGDTLLAWARRPDVG